MTKPWDWEGARWWRCDLHVHTPASHDYTQRETVTYADWVDAVKASGLDVVAVTDHNTGAAVDEVRDAAFVAFPGVELTVSPGVHLLALFDPSRGRDAVTALLGACKIPAAEFGKKEAISPKSVREAMEAIRSAGGLCIAAHIDAKRGVVAEQKAGEDLKAILRSADLAAVEVKHEDPEWLKYIDGTIPEYIPTTGPVTQVRSSDAHTPGDIGSRSTWIKMTRPTLEGLRLALQDGPLSVRRHAPGEDPNAHVSDAIESITVTKARHIGHNPDFVLPLNPWLNALIGGRGAGKSTLVELLRAAMRRESELPASLRTDWDEMIRVPDGRGSRGILTHDTVVTVVYRKDHARFRIQWSPNGTATPIAVEQADGSWTASPGGVADRFPVRIYSQKQVYELTRDPEALLGIVDDAPAVDLRSWTEAWTAEESRFLSLRAQARELQATLADEPRVLGELEDVRRKLAVFEASGHAGILKRWQRRRRQQRAIEVRADELDRVVEALDAAADAVAPPAFDSVGFDGADPADASVLDAAEAIDRALVQLHSDVQASIARAKAIRDAWLTVGLASPWQTASKEIEDAYEALVVALKAAGGAEPTEYGRLVQQRQVLETRLSSFAGKRTALGALEQQASDSLARLGALRRELTDRRARFLATVLAGNPLVRIEVIPMGGVSRVASELRRRLGREDGETTFSKDIGSPGEAGTLVGDLAADYVSEFLRADPTSRATLALAHEARLEALKKRLWDIRRSTAEAADKRFAQHMAGRPPEQMDRLDAWFPPDALRVSFKGKGKGFQPIEQGSPGQRSAALLAFLLSHGDEPIVLDQPEDDLDNQLVYELIVQQLRAIKLRRQVLVVTHNANIVVNGDAELVVALDVVNTQTAAKCQGGLQEQSVRDAVCEVMEGGAEAFRERYRRIAHGGGGV